MTRPITYLTTDAFDHLPIVSSDRRVEGVVGEAPRVAQGHSVSTHRGELCTDKFTYHLRLRETSKFGESTMVEERQSLRALQSVQ